MSELLRLSDVEVRYGRVPALHGVDLVVHEGEMVGIFGPNGAGKTTLLHAVVGLLRPSRGTIELDGAALERERPEAIVRRGVALVPEGRRIFGSMTVDENLRLALNGRRDRSSFDTDLRGLFETLPKLRELRHATAGKLSGGEQQMLAIGRALLCAPRLMLLDEPSLGLAPVVVDAVMEVVAALRERGVTIVMVEQHVQRSLKLVDRAYVLQSGRVVLEGSAGWLSSLDRLSDTYLGAAR